MKKLYFFNFLFYGWQSKACSKFLTIKMIVSLLLIGKNKKWNNGFFYPLLKCKMKKSFNLEENIFTR